MEKEDYDNNIIKITTSDKKEKSESSSSEIIKETKLLNIKCFKWLHNNKKRKYDEMFDYDTEKFKLSEYVVRMEGGSILDNFINLKFLEGVILEKNEEDFDKNSGNSIVNSHQTKHGIVHFSNGTKNREFLNENIVIECRFSKGFNQEFLVRFNKYAYIVTKYLKENSPFLNLNIGNFIRVGKFLMKILVLKLDEQLKFKLKYTSQDDLHSLNRKNSENEEKACRFCFKPGEDNQDTYTNTNNHLISVCNCKGTLKYLHSSCLSMWLKNRCDIQYIYLNPHFYKIKIKNFFCEICKKTFPLIIPIKNKNNEQEYIYLINMLKSKNNFVLMKCTLIDDENKMKFVKEEKEERSEYEEYLYIELPTTYKKSIIIGRDKNCDVILEDISVSRKHCVLYIDRENSFKTNLKIKDSGSKFGTLINMEEDIVLNELNPNITLQKGNTVYHFKLKSLFV